MSDPARISTAAAFYLGVAKSHAAEYAAGRDAAWKMVPEIKGHDPAAHKDSFGKKIAEARRLVPLGRWSPASPAKLKANFDELEQEFGLETTLPEDQTEILLKALSEIKPEHYVGKHPPERSYEPLAQDLELWAFKCPSPHFGNQQMYLKFCFSKGDDTSRQLFFFSIHQHRTT